MERWKDGKNERKKERKKERKRKTQGYNIVAD